MFFKILGGLIILAGTSTIGFLLGGVYKERVNQIKQLQYALHSLESEVVFSSSTLVQAFYKIGSQSKGAVSKLFNTMAEYLKNKKFNTVAEAFIEASKEVSGELYIENEEKETLISFMQSLGSSDLEGQKKNFNLTLKKLEEYEGGAQIAREKNEKLYKYLGFCAGAFLVIILV